MFPYPDGGVTVASVVIYAVIQLAFGGTIYSLSLYIYLLLIISLFDLAIFDVAALYITETFCKIPILKTWKTMWLHRHTFFGFFSYGIFTMGFLMVCLCATLANYAHIIFLVNVVGI